MSGDTQVLIVKAICLVILLTAAVYLMVKGIEGWGWLLFIALLISPTFGNKCDCKDGTDTPTTERTAEHSHREHP